MQNVLHVHTWLTLLFPRCDVLTQLVKVTAEQIYRMKRLTDLNKRISIFKTRTKLCFCVCFFRWRRLLVAFSRSSTTRGGSHGDNITSRELRFHARWMSSSFTALFFRCLLHYRHLAACCVSSLALGWEHMGAIHSGGLNFLLFIIELKRRMKRRTGEQ